LLHGADSPNGNATRIQNCTKNESEPFLHADSHEHIAQRPEPAG
jgi:hypothetical protein